MISAKIKNLIMLALLACIIGYLYFNRQDLDVLKSVSLASAWKIGALLFAFFIACGITFALLVRLVGVRLSLLEIVGLTFLTNVVNYMAPLRPGAAAKAIYLKGVKRLDYSRFTAIFGANAFILLFLTGLAALIVLTIIWLEHGLFSPDVFIASLATTTGALIPLLIRLHWLNFPSGTKLGDFLNNVLRGFDELKGMNSGMLLVCLSVVVQFFLSAYLMKAIFEALGHQIDFTLAFAIGILTALANLFTLTPSNIGVFELVIAYVYSIMGMDFSEGLIGAGLLRAFHIGITFCIGPIFIGMMLHSAGTGFRNIFRKQENA